MLILIPLSVFLEVNTFPEKVRVLKSAKICHKWAISLVINSFSQFALCFETSAPLEDALRII